MMWLLISTIAVILVVAFLINFYRDPERKIPKGENIVSPADGKIIHILKAKKDEAKIKKGFLGKIDVMMSDIAKECYVISIFMSPFDVHINRSPVDGKVVSLRHEKGNFFPAYGKSSLQNEKNEIIIQNKKIGKVKVVQIAGFLARRIICTAAKNEKVNKGQRIGRIVLGSQVTLIIPSKKIKILVKNRQKVRGGNTVIADLR
ncbi:phosphatidylserine decarboxylase [Candidatus Woesearchaeota archaeon]|nr:phosphatidylserine decarboxylase [Candidatus Woesearchaeota archaeon]